MELRIEMVPVDLANRAEVKKLIRLDLEMFGEEDYGDTPGYWKGSKAFWIFVDEQLAGSVAYWPEMKFTDGESWENNPGWAYFGSLGVREPLRGKGIEDFVEAWEVQQVRAKGFKAASTNERASSEAAIATHRGVGFKLVRTMDDYWDDPEEPNLIFEMQL